MFLAVNMYNKIVTFVYSEKVSCETNFVEIRKRFSTKLTEGQDLFVSLSTRTDNL